MALKAKKEVRVDVVGSGAKQQKAQRSLEREGSLLWEKTVRFEEERIGRLTNSRKDVKLEKAKGTKCSLVAI